MGACIASGVNLTNERQAGPEQQCAAHLLLYYCTCVYVCIKEAHANHTRNLSKSSRASNGNCIALVTHTLRHAYPSALCTTCQQISASSVQAHTHTHTILAVCCSSASLADASHCFLSSLATAAGLSQPPRLPPPPPLLAPPPLPDSIPPLLYPSPASLLKLRLALPQLLDLRDSAGLVEPSKNP